MNWTAAWKATLAVILLPTFFFGLLWLAMNFPVPTFSVLGTICLSVLWFASYKTFER